MNKFPLRVTEPLWADEIERLAVSATGSLIRPKMICWLSLSGLLKKEIVSLRLSWIHLQVGLISHHRRSYRIGEETRHSIADWLEVRPHTAQTKDTLYTNIYTGAILDARSIRSDISLWLDHCHLDGSWDRLHATWIAKLALSNQLYSTARAVGVAHVLLNGCRQAGWWPDWSTHAKAAKIFAKM